MTTSLVVVVAGVVPLVALILWLDRTVARFTPPRAEEATSFVGDVQVRRLAEELDRAQADPALRSRIYSRVVQDLLPTVRRRLAASADLSVEARARLRAVLQPERDEPGAWTSAQLEQLLSDLEQR